MKNSYYKDLECLKLISTNIIPMERFSHPYDNPIMIFNPQNVLEKKIKLEKSSHALTNCYELQRLLDY